MKSHYFSDWVSHCGRDGHCSLLLKGFRSTECNTWAAVTLKQLGVCNDLGSFKKEVFLRTVLHFPPKYSEQLVVYSRWKISTLKIAKE